MHNYYLGLYLSYLKRKNFKKNNNNDVLYTYNILYQYLQFKIIFSLEFHFV